MTRLWDYTALSVFEKCEEEGVRRFLRNVEGRTRDLSAFFGQAVHAGVAGLYQGLQSVEAEAIATVHFERVSAPILATPYFVNKKAYLTGEYAAAIVRMYGELRAEHLDCVMNERYLEWSEAGYCGVVDRVRFSHTGRLGVHDLKTTGLAVGEAWGNQWQQSAQAAGYLDLAEFELNRERGVLERDLRARATDASATTTAAAPSLPPYRSVSEFWCDAIHTDRRGVPKAEDFHEYGPFEYSAALRDEMRRTRAQAIFRANELTQWPELAQKRTSACFRFNSLCALFRYCHADPEERDARYELALASGELVTRHWNPANRDDG